MRPAAGGNAASAEDSPAPRTSRSEEHTSELQSRLHLVCRLLLEIKKTSSKLTTTMHDGRSRRRYTRITLTPLHRPTQIRSISDLQTASRNDEQSTSRRGAPM